MMKAFSPRLPAVWMLAAALIAAPLTCPAEEKEKQPLNREQRATIDYVLVLEAGEELDSLMSNPGTDLEEKVLQEIEKRQDITIKRSSMVKTEKCLLELLSGVANLAKVSNGKKIVRLKFSLECDTTRATIWSSWRHRKLEAPSLALTVYYDDGTCAPSEIVCQGHQYH
ncbi:MAG: hypothetical protein ACLFPD_03190 [Desulfosudaceae bacterium]